MIYFSEFQLQPRDRLIMFSDGVTQSGGTPRYAFGLATKRCRRSYPTTDQTKSRSRPRSCASVWLRKARENDMGKAADDITAAAIYLRKPRKTLLVTGPPYKREHDAMMAETFKGFQGKKVVCGGTPRRSSPVATETRDREPQRHAQLIGSASTAHIEGVDLVTEGTITLSRAPATPGRRRASGNFGR